MTRADVEHVIETRPHQQPGWRAVCFDVHYKDRPKKEWVRYALGGLPKIKFDNVDQLRVGFSHPSYQNPLRWVRVAR